jgi:DNA modification methylase
LGDVTIWQGDCREWLPRISSGTVDAVITDPPYPEIDRDYGRITEVDWHEMMRVVVAESRRILKPSGSAVFILQPNSERVGRMRPWLFEFQARMCRDWNMVQDVWWWNTAAIPEHHAIQGRLMRPSLKACVWLGDPECYRDQKAILWSPTEQSAARLQSTRAGRNEHPSGHGVSSVRVARTVKENGGVTPYNLIPIPNTNHADNGGRYGHPAATPMALCDYWVRYICPVDGTVLDPFAGSGTVPLAALARGRRAISIEKEPKYIEVIRRRVERPHAPVRRTQEGVNDDDSFTLSTS